MKCPRCGYNGSYIIDSREPITAAYTRRVHKCKSCEGRYGTLEIIVRSDLGKGGNLFIELQRRLRLEMLQEMVAELQDQLNKEIPTLNAEKV